MFHQLHPCIQDLSHTKYQMERPPTISQNNITSQRMEIQDQDQNNHQSLESSLQAELANLPKFSPVSSIYRIPRHIQLINEQHIYTPLVVSIGPLHHHDNHLLPMQLHKLKYLQSFLHRSKPQDLKIYLQIVQSHEHKIRQCYTDPMVGLVDGDQLTKMVLVDAAFLIELFMRNKNPELIDDDDQMFNSPRMVVEVSRDICLEENQLPFFILCELYKVAISNQIVNFIDIACTFLGIAKERTNRTHLPPFPRPVAYQLLAYATKVQRNHDLHSSTNEYAWRQEARAKKQSSKKNGIVCKTATALHEAGVKFRVKDSSQCSLLYIEFKEDKATLCIPRIVVQDGTEALFKNLAVFEQFHYFSKSYIVDYISFIDFLINTPQDVKLLVKEGIIENWLGSEERVAELFNGLGKQLRLRSEDFYYAKLSKQLEAYSNKMWNRSLALLRQKYFNHPWAVISVIYAIVLLLLTVLQAATGVISRKSPNSVEFAASAGRNWRRPHQANQKFAFQC